MPEESATAERLIMRWYTAEKTIYKKIRRHGGYRRRNSRNHPDGGLTGREAFGEGKMFLPR